MFVFRKDNNPDWFLIEGAILKQIQLLADSIFGRKSKAIGLEKSSKFFEKLSPKKRSWGFLVFRKDNNPVWFLIERAILKEIQLFSRVDFWKKK